MTRNPHQPIRDAAALLTLIVLALTVRIGPRDTTQEPAPDPQVQAASAIPVRWSVEGYAPAGSSPRSPVSMNVDPGLADLESRRFVIRQEETILFDSHLPAVRSIRVLTPGGEAVCPDGWIIGHPIDVGTAIPAAPGAVLDSGHTRLWHIIARRAQRDDPGCST